MPGLPEYNGSTFGLIEIRTPALIIAMLTSFIRTCLLLALLPSLAVAADPPAARREQDEAAIRQAGKDYLAALQRGNGKEIAEIWTADGTYTDETGHAVKVREQLSKSGDSKTAARARAGVSNVSIRFVTADVAVEEGEAEIHNPDGPDAIHGRFTAMWVRQEGRWRLDSLRESRTQQMADPQQLASLDLLVGQWAGELEKSTVRVTAKWNASKSFLQRDLTISSGEQMKFSGTQLIGWDPVSHRVKSWVFNSDGSRGEAFWSLEGTLWLVNSSIVSPEGKTAASLQTYKLRDRDTILWRSMRNATDKNAPADFEVTFHRVKPVK